MKLKRSRTNSGRDRALSSVPGERGRRDNLTGSEQIFYSGFKEFARLHRANSHAPEAIVEGASRAMRISMNRELETLETHIPFLGTVGSISPYIGLFGTVWGIMHAFIALGAVKQATLQMVAPVSPKR